MLKQKLMQEEMPNQIKTITAIKQNMIKYMYNKHGVFQRDTFM